MKLSFRKINNEPILETEGKGREFVLYATSFIVLCVCIIGGSICIGKLISMWSDDMAASALIVKFEDESLLTSDNTYPLGNQLPLATDKDSQNDTQAVNSTIQTTASYNYDALTAQIPATAYIRIPNTTIRYPVMHSKEEGYYLNHAADGSLNRNGSIYLATENSPTFTDPINYIFGHNMRSGLMFRHLNKFLNTDYLALHPDCYIVTQEGTLHYTLFYAASVSPDTQLKRYNEAALGTDTYATYMAELSEMTGLELDAEDRLIVLVTCTTSNHQNRTIVYGYLN